MKNNINPPAIMFKHMAKIILSTMYDASPVIFAITKFGADRIIVVLNKESDKEQDKALETLQNSFKGVLEVKTIKVDPYDVVQIARETTKAIDLMSDKDQLIVNISGGRKTMALGLLYAAYARSSKISKIVYCSEEKQVIQLPKLSFKLTPSQQKVIELIDAGKHKNILDMADKIEISRGMLYRNIKELQDLGLLEENDGLKLTDAGRISVL